MFRFTREITGVSPEIIFNIGNFKITNSTLLSLFILILMLNFCYFIIRRYKIKPNKSQTTVEIIFEAILDFITQITGSKKYALKVFPLIATIFVYIGISNLISLIPGLTSIQFNSISIFRSPTSDFNTTFGLALGSVILLQVVSIKDFGFFGHLGKFFKFKELYFGFKKGLGAGFMAIIDFLIGLLDIVGEIAKLVSLSLRLFGNMYAGEVLAILILGAFAYFLPITWSAMSILSGIVQSLVFGSLVTAYYMLAIKPVENENE
jgi:F-type H+-transporting ATPase subunit a